MPKQPMIAFGGIAVLALMTFAIGRLQGRDTSAAPSPVVFTVQRGTVATTVRETGTVEPLTKVEVKSKVGGRVLRTFVEEGQRVRSGQLLAQLDPAETQSQVDQIRAQIAAAQARLAQARTELQLEVSSTQLSLADAAQGLHSASARLAQAEHQSSAQPSLSRAAIEQAEANYREAQAALAALQDATHPQMVADARNSLDQAQANAETTGKQLHRFKALLAKGYVPQTQVDDAQRDYDNACSQRDSAQQTMKTLTQRLAAERNAAEARVAQTQAALDAARANGVQDLLREDDRLAARAAYGQAMVGQKRALSAQGQVAVKRANVDAARASVKQLNDQLAQVMINLHDTTIRAPMSGTITRRYVEAGELVTSGIATFSSGTPVVQIADLSRMRVVCQINEVDVARIRVGQEAEIVLDSARNKRYPGQVVSVAPAATAPLSQDPQASSSAIIKFEVKIAVTRTDGQLRPGMSAALDIHTASRRGVLYLPLDAVDMSSLPAHVALLRGGNALTTDVVTGLQNNTLVEIREGLKEGDRVLPVPYRGAPRKRFNILTGKGN
jgi:HlyD family secretion protein